MWFLEARIFVVWLLQTVGVEYEIVTFFPYEMFEVFADNEMCREYLLFDAYGDRI
jgi:hypothetical protein